MKSLMGSHCSAPLMTFLKKFNFRTFRTCWRIHAGAYQSNHEREFSCKKLLNNYFMYGVLHLSSMEVLNVYIVRTYEYFTVLL